MTFVVSTILFPVLVAVLSCGWGLLVERASGRRIAGALVAPLGFAAMLVVSYIVTDVEAVALATPWVLLAGALAGLAVGWGRLRDGIPALRREPWPLLAGVATYVIACLPVLLAGRVTLAGYLLDTTVATQLAGGDFILHHGHDFARLVPSSYQAYLVNYFGHAYPAGTQVTLASIAHLINAQAIWLYQPYLSMALALTAPSLWVLGRRFGLTPALAGLAAVCASVPALVYSYELMGAIKEIVLIPVGVLLIAVVLAYRGWLGRGWRAVLPLAVAAAAGVAAIGLAFAGWLALALLVALVLGLVGVRRGRVPRRALLIQIGALVVALLVLTLPTLTNLGKSLTLAKSLSASNPAAAADPGNLLGPLHLVQTLGIWLGGSHRVPPTDHYTLTYALIGIAILAVAFGALELVRRRSWVAVAYLAGLAVVLAALTKRGTIWIDAKLLVIISPMVVLLAFTGVGALMRMRRRVEAVLLAAVLAGGVFASDAILYHWTNLAPTSRFQELASIGERFDGQGPTLVSDFDEFAFTLLPGLDVNGPGFAFHPADGVGTVLAGYPAGYGSSPDLDGQPLDVVRRHRLIVERRSPEHSRPPFGYRRVFSGDWYEVWQRTPAAERVLAHVGASGDASAAGRPACTAVHALERQARAAGGSVIAAVRPPVVVIDPARVRDRSAGWGPMAIGVGLGTPGQLRTHVRVPHAGRYRVWLEGDFSRAVEVLVDGRSIGSRSYESGGNRNYAEPLDVTLSAGRHTLEVRRGGGGLHPGDGGPSRLVRIVVEPQPATERIVTIPRRDQARLCHRDVDWVEALRPAD